MDVPILVAIISATAGLTGTVVGGSLVTAGNYFLARRREQLDLRTGCRLVRTELFTNHEIIETHIKSKDWWGQRFQLASDDWYKYNSTLATHLSKDSWDKVHLAAVGVILTRTLANDASQTNSQTISDGDLEILTSYNNIIEIGRETLDSYI